MNERAALEQLLIIHYDLSHVVLEAVPHISVPGRGVYRVICTDGSVRLLRASTDPHAAVWWIDRANVLDYLEKHGFAAPHVYCTRDGAIVGEGGGWYTLLLSYIDGITRSFGHDDVIELGATLGALHNVPLPDERSDPLPGTEWSPRYVQHNLIEPLTAVMDEMPPELRSFCSDIITAADQICALAELPQTIIHRDCWPNNAIRTPEGTTVLIDWDGAGVSTAILDLAYLLLACHVDKPIVPRIEPDRARIDAVLLGYWQQRQLRTPEIEQLGAALMFVSVFHAARSLPQIAHGDWRNDPLLHKLQARFAAGPSITQTARNCLQRKTHGNI